MEAEHLTQQLQGLNLRDPEGLPFRPTGKKAWLNSTLTNVPRYLFRIFTPKSCGSTDASWTKSKDAREMHADYAIDIFSREKDEQVAAMINRHLRWCEGEDNLVSWTSSLLFALVYIFHLHANTRDNSPLDDIFLCIVDTKSFSEGIFIKDLDLIKAYHLFDSRLKNLQKLRTTGYYFGEYLSQGSLKIEAKCGIVSAQAMIDRGLFNTLPSLQDFSMWEVTDRPPWANEVIRLRRIYNGTTARTEASQDELLAAVSIAELFEPRWRLTIAANIISLQPRSPEDCAILHAMRNPPFTGMVGSSTKWHDRN